MRAIPKKMRDELSSDPFMAICCRKDGNCHGRITYEHCWTYAGRQINEKFAIVPLCWHHHLGAGFDKNYGRWVSLNRATCEDFAQYPKVNWKQIKQGLDNTFGEYRELV